MSILALALATATSVALPQERTFWKPSGFRQEQVTAELVASGSHIAVYRDTGYEVPGHRSPVTAEDMGDLIELFDDVIYPRITGMLGPAPDLDDNGRILLLLTDTAPRPALTWRYDLLAEGSARRLGLRSNAGEVIYHSMIFRGNRAVWNERELAAAFAALLQHRLDPAETAWTELIANYVPYLIGMGSPRLLWGDEDPFGATYAMHEPWRARGWSLLLLHYLHERHPDAVPAGLAEDPALGLAGLADALGSPNDLTDVLDGLADAAMAAWTDDPDLDAGRFSYATVAPPRPAVDARFAASRPASGQVIVGIGGFAFLVVEGDGRRSLPLALQGDPDLHWVARAVHRRPGGPDREIPVAFRPNGSAQVSLPALSPGESVVIAIGPFPDPAATFDLRPTTLHWGIGWIPTPEEDRTARSLADLADRALPSSATLVDRVDAVLSRLAGLSGPVATRFAWAPDAAAAVDAIREEAASRGLHASVETFTARSSTGLEQEWSNVIVELAGDDPRRWPVVIAAHWDSRRSTLADSYLRARTVNDNASGVAAVLEAAAGIAQQHHRAPVIAAILAGGHENAVGGAALLDRLGGKVAAWIELDGVGAPEEAPRYRAVAMYGGERLPQVPQAMAQALRRVGLGPHATDALVPDHTAVGRAEERGIPALALRTRVFTPPDSRWDLPAPVERRFVSAPLVTLVAAALADAALEVAGRP